MKDAPTPDISKVNASSQTDLPDITCQPTTLPVSIPITHVIANVQENGPVLPLVNINIANLNFTFLLDTGSSVSIVGDKFFQQIKQLIKIRYLSRSVKITTLNSTVNFSSCVEFTIKIESKSFKHSFYVVNIAEDSSFCALLGYDFLRKFRVVINEEYTGCHIHDLYVPFLSLHHNSDLNHSLKARISSDSSQCSQPVIPVSQSNSDHINVNSNLHSNAQSSDNSNCNMSRHSKVWVSKKSYLAPQEKKFIQVHTEFDSIFNSDLVFSATSNTKFFEVPDAILKVNLNDSNKNKSNSKLVYSFHVLVESTSSAPVHLNKGRHIGFLSSIDHVKCSENSSSNSSPVLDDSVQLESVNLIQPTEEILRIRREEFNLENFNLNHLPPHEKSVLSDILKENFAAFSSSLKSLGHTDLVKPEIKFTSECSIKCLPFPIPQALQAEAKKQIQELVEAGIIERNLSNWACPMLLVKKKATDSKAQQTYRMALDLRLINSIIEGSSYPLPKIQDLISHLAKFKFFTSLDMPSAYHQLDLPEQYQDKLSFATPWATYKFLRVVFGLKTAAQYFQSLADTVIDEVAEDGIYAYQDDFMAGSCSFEETCNKLQKILKVFIKHNLTLSPKKCSFHQINVQYLGFEISQHKVYPISSNIKKINSFPVPKSKKQVKRLLGVCGYYRHLIPAYAKLTDPLIKLTSVHSSFIWDSVHQEAFENLQRVFFNKPFLCQPDFKEKFYLNTDASDFAISAILMQKRGEDLLPISYYSKTLKPSERKYPAIKLELMAIFKGVVAFKYYLIGRRFYILSDSEPLKYYSKVESPANIVSRWLLALGEYDYDFTHVPGKQNLLADYFSRTPFPNTSDITTSPELLTSNQVLPLPTEENVCATHTSPAVETVSDDPSIHMDNLLSSVSNLSPDPILEITNSTILKEQLFDENLKSYYKEVLSNNSCKDLKPFKICKETNLLLFNNSNKSKVKSHKIALPKSLRRKALTIAHVSHFGIHKTYDSLSSKYFWKGIYEDTVNFIQSCEVCATSKAHRIPQAPFQNNPLPEYPGDFLSMDLVGPFKNDFHILTIIDRFSRYLQMYPIKTISSENVVDALFKYTTVHGRPSQIHSDLGKQFTAKIFNDFTSKFGIRLNHSSPCHPESNAISERINQSIKSTIIALQKDGYNFFNAINIHLMMYNSAIHSSTKYSPNNIHFGRNISTLYDVNLPHKPTFTTDKNRLFFSIMQDLEKIYQSVYSNLQLAQSLQNNQQHKKAKLRVVEVNDTVYLKSSSTFKPKYVGPFKVIRKCGPVNLIIQRSDLPEARQMKVHINRLWIPVARQQHLIPDEVPSSLPPAPECIPVPPPNVHTSPPLSSDEALTPTTAPPSDIISIDNNPPPHRLSAPHGQSSSENNIDSSPHNDSESTTNLDNNSKPNPCVIPIVDNVSCSNPSSFSGYSLRPLSHRLKS